jgi:hypothetical protein
LYLEEQYHKYPEIFTVLLTYFSLRDELLKVIPTAVLKELKKNK